MVYDIAIDLGSTNISVSIFHNKKKVKSSTIKNSLRQYGADIITRLTKYNSNDALRAKYQNLLLSDIKYLLGELSISKIDRLAIAGNTIMMYFFFGKDATSLGQFPFRGEFDSSDLSALNEKISSFIAPVQELFVPPILGGYVGSDMSSVLFSIEFRKPQGNYLVVDLGTNAEIALKYQDRFFVASAAAGPAFGYRGSELISNVAACLESGAVARDGMISDPSGCNLAQPQIRNLQMAKSAIYTAINALLEVAGVRADEISNVFIAGTFGVLVDIDSVKQIKMIPEMGAQYHLLGNASLEGLCNLMLTTETFGWSVITEHLEFVELANSESFSVNYIRNMDF